MYKYYIFAINKVFLEVYKNNPKALYETLKNLYNLDLESFNYGISIYNQLCVPINKPLIENYYKGYKNVDNRFFVDDDLIEINKSCIIIMTKKNNLGGFKYLMYYNEPLYACDFKNGYYSFLTKEYFKKEDNIMK